MTRRFTAEEALEQILNAEDSDDDINDIDDVITQQEFEQQEEEEVDDPQIVNSEESATRHIDQRRRILTGNRLVNSIDKCLVQQNFDVIPLPTTQLTYSASLEPAARKNSQKN